ncbi:VOC family protein [Paenibacillus spongiae]|uniref:VOC family protein n=1 Tax=Paenibacillus spongiae TaxID=2909671 RepID=A0ABY5SL66_9BACL|nr:VOC family protein [Paenibacillus spongiae]UVI33318.1 VOC family protein [Paenibacillus spongiae]
MGESVKAAESALLKTGCFYLPADDVDGIYRWYEKHFNGCTRTLPMYYGKTVEKGYNLNYITDGWLPGEPYEMFSMRFETDCIEELYERLSAADDVKLEPIRVVANEGSMFCFFDPQGNKFQVWQDPHTVTQPLRADVPALIRVAALFFPVSDPAAAHKWYTDFLGVKVNETGQPVTGDGIQFFFHKSLEPGRTLNYTPIENHTTTDSRPASVSIINVAVHDLDAMHHRMLDNGQNVDTYIHDRWGCGRNLLLSDPDGNKLELWEFQAVVEQVESNKEHPDWKERFKFHNYAYNVQVDEFLAMIKNDTTGDVYSGLAVRVINLVTYANLCESDREGLEQLLKTLEQFGKQNPEKAFRILYRDGSEFVQLS